jgi:hypothetical protein
MPPHGTMTGALLIEMLVSSAACSLNYCKGILSIDIPANISQTSSCSGFIPNTMKFGKLLAGISGTLTGRLKLTALKQLHITIDYL